MKLKRASFVLVISVCMLMLAAYSKLNNVYKKQLRNKAIYKTEHSERQIHSIKMLPTAILFILKEQH